MSTARILITGVGGFVGAHLARRIAERGDVALGLGIEPAPPPTARLLAGEWRADVDDATALRAAIGEAQPTAIVHLAGQSSAGLSFEHPIETFRANALGTYTLLETLRTAAPGARILVVGTGEAYGPQPEGSRVAEDAPFRPVSPYALSKAAADSIAAFAAARGQAVVRTRSFGHIGPGQSERFVVASWASQIAEAEAGGQATLLKVGNLQISRDLCDVRDVVEAYLALLERGRPGEAYNVASGVGVSLAVVADQLVARARVPVKIDVDQARMRPADVPYLVGDPGRIERDTGWRATTPLATTLDDVLDHWRERVRSLPSRGAEGAL